MIMSSVNVCNYFWLIILVKKDTYTKKSQCSLLVTIKLYIIMDGLHRNTEFTTKHYIVMER